MRQLTSIVAVNPEGAIGVGNSLPWRVSSDLKFFKEQTLGNVVIMGRRTYDSLGSPLPNRRNVVVTHGFDFFNGGEFCKAAGSIDEALIVADRWSPKKRETFIVGGASMYEQFSTYVDRYLITVVDKEVPNADTFFDIQELADQSLWEMKVIGEGIANGTTDEADFRIFQFTRRGVSSATQRNARIAKWHDRKAANSLSLSSLPSQAFG